MKCHDDTKERFVKRNDLRRKKIKNSSDSDALDETKDDTEMCQDSSEVL